MADQWSSAADAKHKELRGRIFKAASVMGTDSASPSSSLAVVPPLSLFSVFGTAVGPHSHSRSVEAQLTIAIEPS